MGASVETEVPVVKDETQATATSEAEQSRTSGSTHDEEHDGDESLNDKRIEQIYQYVLQFPSPPIPPRRRERN